MGRKSIYSLEGRRGTRASALYCAQTEGAGCPGDGPDVRGKGSGVRAGLGLPDAFGDGGARFSGWGPGCAGLREEPDVRGMVPDVQAIEVASGALSIGRGRISWGQTGCPAPVAAGSSSFSFLFLSACLALVLGFSMVSRVYLSMHKVRA